MKTKVKLLGLMVISITLFSFSTKFPTIVKDSHTDLGRYWLKRAVNLIEVEGESLPTYVVHYDNLDKPVYIGVLEEKRCKTYIVRTDGFEVAYTCKNGVLGIKYLPKRLATYTQQYSIEHVNRENYLKQKVITSKPCSEKEQLCLIATFLPEVMS
ncbi:hypothetical protein ACE1ET_01085 [Saccharicrinis sp. FJH62]|uniref:hypothetical protein n=1 Tax=Saccharicrinis sp. FJH62 TaxID=3344657 RepID=UPI0035D48464